MAWLGHSRRTPTSPRESNQRSLTGSIVDQATGDAVLGAIGWATGNLETTTADDGRFELAGAPSGWIDTLVVVADGYEPLVQRVRRGLPVRLLVVPTGELGGSELIMIEEKLKLEASPRAMTSAAM